MDDIFSKLVQEAEKAEKELCELLDQMDTEAMLSAMIAQLLIGPVEQMVGDRFGTHPALIEILAVNAIPRFGQNVGVLVNLWDSNKCYALAEKILSGRMQGMSKINETLDTENRFDTLSSQLTMHSEIVRGSAYPEQTSQEIIEIQGKFNDWFKSKTGISPSKAIEIIFLLMNHSESVYNANSAEFFECGKLYKENFNLLKKKKHVDENEKEFLETFVDAKSAWAFAYFSSLNEIIPKVLPIRIENLATQEVTSKQEADALKKLIGISKKTINQNTEIQRFPLYILSSGEVILSELSNCLDVLWDGFELVAKSDNKFYQRYQKHKAKWLENKGRSFLERIFPRESIYETLDYPNPDMNGTAELDLAIKWGPFLLLVEAKAKQFRFESLRGDVGRLRTDIKVNIEDAYFQAARATKYVNTTEKTIFTERLTGRKLELNKSSIHKIFPISLSLHHLAGVATQLDRTRELGLFKDGYFPFSICIGDLDCITKTNITPDILLHYIEKRLVVLNASEEWLGDELDLFSAYLDCRLNVKNMSMPSDEKIDSLTFIGSEYFDRLAMYERGELDEKPDISVSLPDQILELLQQLRLWDDDGARWITFALLDLDNKILNALAKAISDIRNVVIDTGVFRRCSFANEEVVITVVGSSSASSSELKDRTIFRAEVEKYRRKVNKSIGIGIVCNGGPHNKSIFSNAQYIKYEWEEDKNLEHLIENEPIFIPVAGSKFPGRNEPCICGSGLKYKKCCLRKIEKAIVKDALPS